MPVEEGEISVMSVPSEMLGKLSSFRGVLKHAGSSF